MEDLANNPKVLLDIHEGSLQNEATPSPKTSSKSSDSHNFLPPKPVEKTAKKQDKYDIKKCSFDVLVAKVGERDFVQNLKNIFNFLTSNNDEQEFRDISREMEEILVRIVRDVDVLKSANIYGKNYCEKIIEILSHTSDAKIFKLACFFKKEAQEILLQGLGVECKNVLVYKKLYQPLNPAAHLRKEFPSMSSLSRSPPLSRSASTDSTTSQRSSPHITPPSTDHFIPHCFQLIINFVQDITQQSLEFTGLSAEDAKLIHTTFSCVIAGDARGKNVCIELWDIFKDYPPIFEFNIMYTKAESLDTKSLLLEKRSWLNASSSTDTHSDFSGRIVAPMTAKQKKVSKKYKNFVKSLNFDFVTHFLEKMVNFLSDDAQGSMFVPYTNDVQKKFLKNISNFSHSEKIQRVFDVKHRKLLSQICKLIDTAGFKMKTSNKKKCKTNEILYSKLPRFENSQQYRGRSCERPSVPYNMRPTLAEEPSSVLHTMPSKLAETQHHMGRPWYPQIETASKHDMSGFVRKAVLNTKSWRPANNLTATNYSASTSQTATVSTSKPTSKEITKAKVSNINFQAAGTMSDTEEITCERDPQLTEVMLKYNIPENFLGDVKSKDLKSTQPQISRSRGRSKEGKLPKKGNQLIQALSVPVRSDKALKMMMGMGWTGGALGTRGDGITEPIMPHLRNGIGAGLGHIKGIQIASKQNPSSSAPPPSDCPPSRRAPAKFREIFLGAMLELLSSDFESKTLEFHPSLHKKELTFVRHAVKTFAARTKFKISDEEQIMVDKVAEHYDNDRELTVTACISDDKRKIVLKKKHGLYHALDLEQKSKLKNMDFELNRDSKIATKQMLDKYGPICQSQKSLESIKFRLKILLDLLNFVKDNEIQIKVDLKTKLSSKQRNYMLLCVSGLNKRARFGSTVPEIALSLEIKKYIGFYTLVVEFEEDFKKFTVTKVYGNSKNLQANLDSDEIDYYSTDDENDVTDDKSDDKIIENEKINKTTENNDIQMEVRTENKYKNDTQVNKTVENKYEVKENINKEIKTEKNILESDISLVDDVIGNSCDDVSMSENSGFTENLDYNETDENMSDYSDRQLNKTLDLSNISLSTLNVGDRKIKNISVILVYLTKDCDDFKDMPKYVQGLISHNIIEIKEKNNLPLLKCHGVRNNFLIYSCHTKKSYDWLQSICVANKINIETKEFDKMSLTIKTFFDFNDKYLFDLLEMYNEDISTKNWNVLKKESLENSVIIDVKMDKKSVMSILESNLVLYAGVDQVTFDIIYD